MWPVELRGQRSFHSSRSPRQGNYYEVLGLPSNSSSDTIKKAYYGLAKKYHPDIAGPQMGVDAAQKKFSQIGEAYETLSSPVKRRDYDLSIGLGSRTNSSFGGSRMGFDPLHNHFHHHQPEWGEEEFDIDEELYSARFQQYRSKSFKRAQQRMRDFFREFEDTDSDWASDVEFTFTYGSVKNNNSSDSVFFDEEDILNAGHSTQQTNRQKRQAKKAAKERSRNGAKRKKKANAQNSSGEGASSSKSKKKPDREYWEINMPFMGDLYNMKKNEFQNNWSGVDRWTFETMNGSPPRSKKKKNKSYSKPQYKRRKKR